MLALTCKKKIKKKKKERQLFHRGVKLSCLPQDQGGLGYPHHAAPSDPKAHLLLESY